VAAAVEEVSGAAALVQALVVHGVTDLFGLPGVQLDWLFDALYQARDALRVYHTRHEQTAAYMADGYARTTGQVGVCAVVPGPGLLNASAALATAYACSSPVLCLTGQIDSRAIDARFGLLHEIPHQEAVLGVVTKWSGRALDPGDIPGLVHTALATARSGRPRPVALEVPADVLQRATRTRATTTAQPELQRAAQPELQPIRPGNSPAPATADLLEGAGDTDMIRRAAEILRAAERPVIYSGGGTLAAGAWTELQHLAEMLEAPVVMSVDGRGALSDRHDLAHTGVTGQALVREADVVLGVGTRFWQPSRVWGLAPDAAIVRIDADPDEIDRHQKPRVGITGDARLVLSRLLEELDGLAARPSRRKELRARKEDAERKLAAFQPQADFAQAMRNALPDDAITVNDLTQVAFFATVGFPVYAPRTFIGPGYQGTLGSAFPTSLGAQAGNPHRPVVAISGDGGFMYAVAELATQRQHGLNVVSIVFNDSAFGNVKRTQQQAFGGRLIASDLVNPDFVALARSFGVDAERISTPKQLEGALRSALSTRAPALIEVSVGEMSNPWPVLGPAGGVYPVLLEHVPPAIR
jgi:acetolactate synthase-1/2/3 large subunit